MLFLQVRALELAQSDEATTSLTQLIRIKKEKEALTLTKDKVEKAQAKVEAKLEAYWKLWADVSIELQKSLDEKVDLKKQVDLVTGKQNGLSGKIKETQEIKEAANEKSLEWQVAYKAQIEYISHLEFILGPEIDKLLKNLADGITALPGEVRVEVRHTDHRAILVTATAADVSALAADDTFAGTELDGASTMNIIYRLYN